MTLPLSNIRIVEMGQLIAIPYATKLLADMGAEVIRVESCVHPDGYRSQSFYENEPGQRFWDRAANFYEQNRNKLGITLDLSKPRGLEALRGLISISDVFAENYTPRVMKNFGLEYQDLRKIKPDIIVVSSTGYGYTGPWANFGAIGYTTEAASGLAYVTGYEGGPPMIPEIPYADYTAAEHTAFAIMAALLNRERTGQGQFIDVSQTETLSSTIPEVLMDYSVNGRTRQRRGSQDPPHAPQGAYPCRGDDRWIAISVTSDSQWRELVEALGSPAWAISPDFGDSLSRWKRRDGLDALLAGATSQLDQMELMHALQQRGVPAGAVLNGKQLLFDQHLVARRFYEVAEHHPDTRMPPLPYASRPWKMSETPGGIRSAAPLLGEHSRHVLSAFLGMSDEQVRQMERDGVTGRDFANPRPPPVIPLADQKRLGRILDYEADFKEQVQKAYLDEDGPGTLHDGDGQ